MKSKNLVVLHFQASAQPRAALFEAHALFAFVLQTRKAQCQDRRVVGKGDPRALVPAYQVYHPSKNTRNQRG